MIIVNFFKQGFSNLSFWLKQRVRIKQLRIKLEANQKDLSDLFAQIGKDVYLSHEHTPTDPTIIATYDRIAALEEALLALEQEIVLEQKRGPANRIAKKVISYAQDDEGTQTCPKCNTIMAAPASFCSSCGMSLQPTTSQDTTNL